jgi:hypothetical protein
LDSISLSSGDWIPLGIEVGVSMLEKGRNDYHVNLFRKGKMCTKSPMEKVRLSKQKMGHLWGDL